MNDAMGELSARFRAEAVDTTGQIAGLLDALAAQSDPAPTCERVRELAHKLRGAAGIFGFSELKARASELEGEASAQSAAADGAVAAARLRVVLDEMTAALPEE